LDGSGKDVTARYAVRANPLGIPEDYTCYTISWMKAGEKYLDKSSIDLKINA